MLKKKLRRKPKKKPPLLLKPKLPLQQKQLPKLSKQVPIPCAHS